MSKAKIMVVEDESIVAMDIRNCLRGLGYEVPIIAYSGEEAIKKAEETRPDLVLIDIKLRGEMDGIEAAEQICDRLGIPVVYLSALGNGNTMQRAEKTGSSGYIHKPFEEEELRAIIEKALCKEKN